MHSGRIYVPPSLTNITQCRGWLGNSREAKTPRF